MLARSGRLPTSGDYTCDELEGVVAKRRSGWYLPGGDRAWIKTKNRDSSQYATEAAAPSGS
jgi:ATP-dependent DNA ligase